MRPGGGTLRDDRAGDIFVVLAHRTLAHEKSMPCGAHRTACQIPFPFGIFDGIGITAVHIPVRYAVRYPRAVEKLHAKNMSVAVWTANSAEDISRASEIGADAIITDDPVLALRLLGRK